LYLLLRPLSNEFYFRVDNRLQTRFSSLCRDFIAKNRQLSLNFLKANDQKQSLKVLQISQVYSECKKYTDETTRATSYVQFLFDAINEFQSKESEYLQYVYDILFLFEDETDGDQDKSLFADLKQNYSEWQDNAVAHNNLREVLNVEFYYGIYQLLVRRLAAGSDAKPEYSLPHHLIHNFVQKTFTDRDSVAKYVFFETTNETNYSEQQLQQGYGNVIDYFQMFESVYKYIVRPCSECQRFRAITRSNLK
jgi:hypothetical protein